MFWQFYLRLERERDVCVPWAGVSFLSYYFWWRRHHPQSGSDIGSDVWSISSGMHKKYSVYSGFTVPQKKASNWIYNFVLWINLVFKAYISEYLALCECECYWEWVIQESLFHIMKSQVYPKCTGIH